MIAADVSYISADAEVVTDYNSKNKLLSDSPTISDAAALAVSIKIVDAVYASDLRWSTYSGLLNGAPFNVHAILEDSSETIDPPFDDVTITIS
jgi:hypothetical protein